MAARLSITCVSALLAWATAFSAAAQSKNEPQALVGVVQSLGGTPSPTVRLNMGQGESAKHVVLRGELLPELQKLTRMKVEVLGSAETDQAFVVQSYRIIDIGNGQRPMVGELVSHGNRLALRDGDGSTLPLSLPPRAKRRLWHQVGAKVWLSGKALVSGELKVSRFGILRAAPKK